MKKFIIMLLLSVFAVVISECGSDNNNDKKDNKDMVNDFSDTIVNDSIIQENVDAVVETKIKTEPEDYKIVFGYQGRIAGVNNNKFDLWVVNPDAENLQGINLTEYSLSKLGLNCDYGCIVDDKLNWIAVAPEQADTNGTFSVKIGKINENYEVFLHKGGTISGIVALQFAGDKFFYSTIKQCNGAGKSSCQYQIQYIDLSNDANEQHVVGIFPPDNDVDYQNGGSNYQGHFTVSPDGKSVIVLSTTIKSVRVYIARDGLISELDYICQNNVGGQCSGTGSWYSDRDPIAISHDSKYVVFLTKADKSFLIRLYNTQDFQDKRWSTLIKLPSGSTSTIADNAAVCANKQPWQFISTPEYSKPVFDKNDENVIIPGVSDCNPDARPDSNLYKINVNKIGDGTLLTKDDIVPLIQKPNDNSVQNIIVQNFTFSPEYKWIVLSATPMFQQNGELIPEGSSRSKNDREVFVLDPKNPSDYKQITNDGSYIVRNLFTIKPKK